MPLAPLMFLGLLGEDAVYRGSQAHFSEGLRYDKLQYVTSAGEIRLAGDFFAASVRFVVQRRVVADCLFETPNLPYRSGNPFL